MSEATFVGLEIPADPAWEPMEFSDVLDTDGAYCALITGDKAANLGGKNGVRITFQLNDSDVSGRKLSKFLQDPRENEKVWFLWRGIMMSIAGDKSGARGAFSYRPGAFTGQTVYFKVESYLDNDGERRSGVGQWLTKGEYDQFVSAGKHRWPAAVRGAGASRGTPAGTPSGFPGLPAASPGIGGPPQPAASAPIQAAPVAHGTIAAPQNGMIGVPAPVPFAFPGISKR